MANEVLIHDSAVRVPPRMPSRRKPRRLSRRWYCYCSHSCCGSPIVTHRIYTHSYTENRRKATADLPAALLGEAK